MTKKLLPILLLSLFVETAGAVTTIPLNDYFVPFVQVEGAYTWQNTNPVQIFGRSGSISRDQWGGRGAVGVTHTYPNCFGYTAEMGWGYYGQTSSSNSGTIPSGSLSVSNRSKLYGFDILAGLVYDVNAFQFFLKGGAMLENRQITGDATLQNISGGTVSISTNTIRSISTNALPEIKIGGMYSFTPQVALSLAYMHVFGNSNTSAKVTGAFANPTATAGISSVVNAQNPTLDSIMLGLVWQLV